MAGVSLVGFSGSLAKEAVKDSFIEPVVDFLSAATLPSPEAIPAPEATKVLIGKFVCPGCKAAHPRLSAKLCRSASFSQEFSSFYLLNCCKSIPFRFAPKG